MNAYTEALLTELAPVLERLVTATVQREVSKAWTAAAPLTWRGPYAAGMPYGTGAIVQHGNALYLAIDATVTAPGPSARGWRRLALLPREPA